MSLYDQKILIQNMTEWVKVLPLNRVFLHGHVAFIDFQK